MFRQDQSVFCWIMMPAEQLNIRSPVDDTNTSSFLPPVIPCSCEFLLKLVAFVGHNPRVRARRRAAGIA